MNGCAPARRCEFVEDFGRIGQLQRQVLELRLRIRQLGEDFQKDLRVNWPKLRTPQRRLAQPAGLGRPRTGPTAWRGMPAAGVVVGAGGVHRRRRDQARPAAMDIVPQGEPLLVEARVPVQMVDKVHPGLPVELLPAFNQSTTPRIAGKVTLASADRQVDERTDEPYYTLRAQVGVQLACASSTACRFARMPVEAFVKTGERSMLNYPNLCWIGLTWRWWKNEGAVIRSVCCACSGSVQALGLLDAYDLALRNDPTFRNGNPEREVGEENRIIGRAGAVAEPVLSYNNSRNESEVTQSTAGNVTSDRDTQLCPRP